MMDIRYIFEELLKKGLRNKTQNPKEPVNAVIWARLLKTAFIRLKPLKFSVADAVVKFQ